MNAQPVQPGDVFASGNFCGRDDPGTAWIYRVMACDDLVALCDAELRWNGFRAKARVPARGLRPEAVARLASWPRLGSVPLSVAENRVFGPHLPLRCLRHPTLNWLAFAGLEPSSAMQLAAAAGWNLAAEPALEAPAVEVLVSLAYGALGRKVRIEAGATGRIIAAELLVRVANLLADLGWEAPDGMGLHRSGTGTKGVPSFYLSGYRDRAGHLWRAESSDQVGDPPEWWLRKGKVRVRGDFPARLAKLRRDLPFAGWTAKRGDGLEHYTASNCRKVQRVFMDLIDALAAAGDAAAVADQLALFAKAMDRLNQLYLAEPELIESGERDELCEWLDAIGEAAGLPAEFLGEEGDPTVLSGREW